MSAATPTPAELAPRRRRAWPWVLLGVVVLLVAAGFAIDALARGAAEDVIAERVASALDVPETTPVEVSIGGGPVLFQALTGSLDQVDVEVDGLDLGDLSGDLHIVARGVPIDTSAPTRELTVRLAVPESGLAALSPQITGATIDDVTLDGAEIVATGNLSVLGLSFELGLGLTPSAVGGQLAFDPTSVRIAGAQYTADELRADPVFGLLADALLQQRTVCIADALPSALTVTGLRVEGDQLVATLDGSGTALGGTAFQQKGSCAA
ncbi:LmeA family phospholipid-binding protein [Protaetiibacter mangrovi]|uniref:DUF2993 domain-containing protein n=1 Tax=Protaetiibacter mangrovi TaxID=2970926 RepID=A0ABT1ZIZ0_9MICO|nr:DUF2993 domain-containing protein [Protaetiibacter mangrovi]MCS0500681.1 DUF2993 domain-containing protein [Protaetiibacter mangrovi]TPW92518.1 DUF2993 domain-containing protein [Schumannella luteola]